MIVIIIYFSLFLVLSYLLIKEIWKRKRTYKKDIAMFAMADLRRDSTRYLIDKRNSISQKDAILLIRLIEDCSFTISNHDIFYSNFKWERLVKEIRNEIRQIENTESKLDRIHNKKIKGFYFEFASILFKNMKMFTNFFPFKFFFFFAKTFFILFNKQTNETIKKISSWMDNQENVISGYEKRGMLVN